MRTRLAACGAAGATVIAGLGIRMLATGDLAKYGGDAFYAILIYTLIVAAVPRTRPARAACVTVALTWTIEFFQLTPIPAELSQNSVLARLVLGSTFNAPDLFWYAAGAALAWLAHAAVHGRRSRH